MKVKITEAHDRLEHVMKQSDYISQGCQDCINNRPEEFTMPFYIFAHSRTIENDERMSVFSEDIRCSLMDLNYRRKYSYLHEVPTSRMIWAPRLTKPYPQENSMLFKAYPGKDDIKIIWMIPAKELWSQYEKGNMTEHKIAYESIHDFKNNPRKLTQPETDDLSEEDASRIYREMAKNLQIRKHKSAQMFKPSFARGQ